MQYTNRSSTASAKLSTDTAAQVGSVPDKITVPSSKPAVSGAASAAAPPRGSGKVQPSASFSVTTVCTAVMLFSRLPPPSCTSTTAPGVNAARSLAVSVASDKEVAPMSHPDHQRHEPAAGPAGLPAPEGRVGAARVRAAGRDRPHQFPGRRHTVSTRLSVAEYAQLAAAAREAGLTPSGYAAELTLAAARGTDPPAREPLRVLLAEMVAARADLVRFLRLLDGTSSPSQSPDGAEADRQAVLRSITLLDLAAAAVAQSLS